MSSCSSFLLSFFAVSLDDEEETSCAAVANVVVVLKQLRDRVATGTKAWETGAADIIIIIMTSTAAAAATATIRVIRPPLFLDIMIR